ncbi:3TM-type holin [Deferrisoma camini]|uniref:3TM-type holin n=1 Tax=Deferrisoma camini TaxID=1035120 RepID=UPI00046CDDE1|nr:3TM-type holin [Deferrisoma camini]
MVSALIGSLIPVVGKVIERLVPDKEAQAKAQAEAVRLLMEQSHEIEQAAAQIIRTEAASKHWLAANWRPLLMLTFGALIVARWMGWTAPNLSEAEYLKLWDIVELGIGGYVIGRSAEKVLPLIAETMRR